MKEKIVLIGAGGHAKTLIDTLEAGQNFSIAGLLDPNFPIGHRVLNYPVIGGDEMFMEEKNNADFRVAVAVGSVKADAKRKMLYEKFRKARYLFPKIVHPNAVISRYADLRDGIQIFAGAVVQAEASVGENVILNSGSLIEHECRIGPHGHVAPGAVLGGGVEMGESSFIGLGAKVLPGIKIGRNVTVGAGAVVIRDVPDGETVAGVPARELSKAKHA